MNIVKVCERIIMDTYEFYINYKSIYYREVFKRI